MLDADRQPDQRRRDLERRPASWRASCGPGARSATRRRPATRPGRTARCRGHTAIASSAAPTRTRPCRRSPTSAVRRPRGRGGPAGRGSTTDSTFGWPDEHSATAARCGSARSMRSGECLHAAQHQEAVHRSGHGADGVLEEPEPLVQLVVSSHDGAADHVRVAAEVLRGECTTTSAPSSSGRCRYGVAKVLSTTQRAPRPVRHGDHGRDVDHLQQRVRRRLDPDQPGRLADRCAQGVEVGQVARVDVEPPLPEHACRAAGTCRRRRRRRAPRGRRASKRRAAPWSRRRAR